MTETDFVCLLGDSNDIVNWLFVRSCKTDVTYADTKVSSDVAEEVPETNHAKFISAGICINLTARTNDLSITLPARAEKILKLPQ